MLLQWMLLTNLPSSIVVVFVVVLLVEIIFPSE